MVEMKTPYRILIFDDSEEIRSFYMIFLIKEDMRFSLFLIPPFAQYLTKKDVPVQREWLGQILFYRT